MKMDSMKKGKIAERIVEAMFKEAGFKVINSGYEKTFGKLADRNNLLKGPAAGHIRHHPDLIVVDKFNQAYFIEVKFRTFGTIYQKDLFNYPETQVILLTRDSMHCQDLKKIHKDGKKFVPLNQIKPFSEISKEIVQKYTLKTRRLLGSENFLGQIIEKVSQKIVGKTFEQRYTPGDVKFSYIENYNQKGDSYEIIGNKEIISNKKVKIISSRDSKHWTNQEIILLKDYYKSGTSINDISANLGRKKEAVIFKLAKVGIIKMRQAINLVKGIEIPNKNLHKRNTRHRKIVRRRSTRKRVKKKGNRNTRVRRKRSRSNMGKIRISKITRRRKRR
jgi:hypothetical protein